MVAEKRQPGRHAAQGGRTVPAEQPLGPSWLRPGELQDPFLRKSVHGAFWQDVVTAAPSAGQKSSAARRLE